MIRKFFHWLIEEQKKSNERRERTLGKWNNWANQHSNKKCPKCDSKNLNVVKPGFFKHLMQENVAINVPGAKISKPLNVCRDCGFSWEDR